MRRRSPTRLVVKWVGTLLCALFLAAFLISARWDVVYITSGRAQHRIGLKLGRLYYNRRGNSSVRWRPGWHRLPREGHLQWKPRWHWSAGPGLIYIPLWMPFVLVGVPTGLLWWRDLRVPPGHCPNCGYDLTGNVSGVCPECGTPVKREGKTR